MSKVNKEIEVFLSEGSQKFTVELFIYGDGMVVIPWVELMRTAIHFKVPMPEMTNSYSVTDNAFYCNIDNKHKLPTKIIRHCATYNLYYNNQIFTGEGSAGADNVGGEQFRSYTFEIAHKRAKARCLIAALGIKGVLCDIEVAKVENNTSDDYGYDEEDNVFAPDIFENECKQSSTGQINSIYNIFAKICDKKEDINLGDIKKCLEIFGDIDIFHSILKTLKLEGEMLLDPQETENKVIPREMAYSVFGFIDYSTAAKIITSLGNFSSTLNKPNSNQLVK